MMSVALSSFFIYDVVNFDFFEVVQDAFFEFFGVLLQNRPLGVGISFFELQLDCVQGSNIDHFCLVDGFAILAFALSDGISNLFKLSLVIEQILRDLSVHSHKFTIVKAKR